MTQTEEFPLERFLAKLISIHTHVDCLAHYVHSPRLRRHFYKKFSVETVNQPHATVVMPNPQDWKRVVTEVLKFPDPEPQAYPPAHNLAYEKQWHHSSAGALRACPNRPLPEQAQTRTRRGTHGVHWSEQVVT